MECPIIYRLIIRWLPYCQSDEVWDQWIQATGDTRPENLTPDERSPEGTISLFWLDDHTVYSSDNDRGKNIYENRRKEKPNIYRGTLPGEEKNASKINRKGPY